MSQWVLFVLGWMLYLVKKFGYYFWIPLSYANFYSIDFREDRTMVSKLQNIMFVTWREGGWKIIANRRHPFEFANVFYLFFLYLYQWLQDQRSYKDFGCLGQRRLHVFNQALREMVVKTCDGQRSILEESCGQEVQCLSVQWCSAIVGGCYGVGVWKYIRGRWNLFSKLDRNEVGDGTHI